MILQDYKLNYIRNLPFHAELVNVHNILPHKHDKELELVYCLKGSLHLEAADQQQLLTEGQVHSIDFDDIHCLWSDEDNYTLLFHIDLSKMKDWETVQYMLFACESNHLFPYQEAAMNSVKDIILSLSYEFFTDIPHEKKCLDALDTLLDIIIKYFNWFNYENQDDYMNPELYERFHRVLIYCLENYKNKISISQIADRENINRNYFSQFIGKTVFSSFSNMVSYIRCYKAEHMLLTTDRPNSEIAYACGFSDPKYFYSAFKALWGCTPSQHRQEYEAYYLEFLKEKPTNIVEKKAAAEYIKTYMSGWLLEKTLRL